MSWSIIAGGDHAAQVPAATTRQHTLGAAVQVGDVISVWVFWYSNTTLSGVADNLGNTYTLSAQEKRDAGDANQRIQMARCIVTNGGTPTITATWGSNAEYRGVLALAARDSGGTSPTFDTELLTAAGSGGSGVSAGTNSLSSGNITVAHNGSLILSVAIGYNGVDSISAAGTGYTLPGYEMTVGGTVFGEAEYNLDVSAGTRTATFTTGATDSFVMGTHVWSPHGAGGSVTPNAAHNRGAPRAMGRGMGRAMRRQMEKINGLWRPIDPMIVPAPLFAGA